MPTYLATQPVTLALPDKIDANGNPTGDAQWSDRLIPAGSLFSYYEGTPWLDDMVAAKAGFEPASDPAGLDAPFRSTYSED